MALLVKDYLAKLHSTAVGPYQLRLDLEIEWISKSGSGERPIASLVRDRLVLEVPTASKVQVLNLGGWKTVFDGSFLVSASAKEFLTLSFESPVTARVQNLDDLSFSVLRVQSRFKSAEGSFLKNIFSNRDSRSFALSVLIHAVLISSFLWLGQVGGRLDVATRNQTVSQAQKVDNSPIKTVEIERGAGMNLPEAFSGRALTQPLNAAQRTASDVKKMQNLASSLSKLGALMGNSPSGPHTPKQWSADSLNQALNSARHNLAGSGAAGGEGLKSGLLAVNSSKSKQISAADEARVRQIFDKMQPRFAAAFENALKVDPKLSLALTYEGVVGDNGHLTKLKMSAKGDYSPSGLSRLQSEVSSILSSADLGKHLSGVIIRGDRLFVQ